MRECKNCRVDINEKQIFECKNCGAIFCENCAKATHHICPHCYNSLDIMG